MPKIEDITYKNELTDFIKYDSIKSKLDETKKETKKIETDVITVLEKELESGGLNAYAANIDGIPIFHEKTLELITKLKTKYDECLEQIEKTDTKAKEHRIEELNQFIKCLNKRIEELKSDIAALDQNIGNCKLQKFTYEAQREQAEYGSPEYKIATNLSGDMYNKIVEYQTALKPKEQELKELEIKLKKAQIASSEIS